MALRKTCLSDSASSVGCCCRSFLYVFLGLASFVVWTQGGFQEQTGPLVLYAVNLALNLAWMPVSFPPSTVLPLPSPHVYSWHDALQISQNSKCSLLWTALD